MQYRFPRTIRELADAGRHIIAHCDACPRRVALDPELLAFTFGEDFDCYAGLAELRGQLCCDECGAKRPRIYFRDPHEKPFEPIGYEDALTRALEFSAYSRATGESASHPGGRIRKFGRR